MNYQGKKPVLLHPLTKRIGSADFNSDIPLAKGTLSKMDPTDKRYFAAKEAFEGPLSAEIIEVFKDNEAWRARSRLSSYEIANNFQEATFRQRKHF